MSEDMSKSVYSLYQLIATLSTPEECKELFEDLCTYKEIDSMAQRLEAAKLLLNGETYEKIIEKTGISSATLSRVSKCVKYGKGYNKLTNSVKNK